MCFLNCINDNFFTSIIRNVKMKMSFFENYKSFVFYFIILMQMSKKYKIIRYLSNVLSVILSQLTKLT
jgi:hypothetical protein